MGDISKDIQSTFPSEKVKALINIVYTANWLNSKSNEHLKPFQITSQQYNILRILKGAGKPITVQTVKDRMVVRAPNATRLMDKLFTKELITRSRCEKDRRIVYIEITEKGIDLVEKCKMDDNDSLLENITDEEAETLNAILDKLR
ncbi:MarR family winged helix-turn-helix transcriptional regulator [Aureivirga sp. CE67]|uniref:MarR family winged helix-turn-helix transcriptional regulator n=1 Tax=Aureivirga sp. CE67 TaxID=1788983 RepID=UPI0018CA84A0|nr:MarR family transcriptional regulator [Aureivirga sp. CE67]